MKKIFAYLLVIYLVFGLDTANSKSPPLGTGTSDVPANILIMLDNSGSMAWGLLDRPIDVGVDSSNNIYVLEYVKGQISVFDSSKKLIRVCANNSLGYKLYFPRHLKIYGTEIFVTDTGNSRVLVINKDTCELKRTINFYGVGQPLGIAVSASKIYLTFNDTYSFLVMDKNWQGTVSTNNIGTFTQYLSSYNNNLASLSTSLSLNSTENKLLITEGYYNRPLQEVTVNDGSGTINLAVYNVSVVGTGTYCWGYCPNNNGYFGLPSGLQAAVYDTSGNIYATDPYNYRMQKFTSSRSYNSKVGTPSHVVPFNTAAGMDRDSSNNIYVADYAANKIYIFNSSLTLTSTLTGGGSDKLVGSKTRMDIAKSVIKKIVSNTELTAGANFGLMEWGYPTRLSIDPNQAGGLRLRVPVSPQGANLIYNDVDKVIAEGSTRLDSALNLAKQYFNYGTSQSVNNIFYNSPIIPGASCQLNYLIVISDGEWETGGSVEDPLAIASNLNAQNPSIKTFIVGFALGGSSSNYASLADKGGTKTPLYAENEEQLLSTLTSAISQILSARLTFANPVPISLVNGDFVFQATFTYARDKQWEGNLKKYKFDGTALDPNYIWDAAVKLNEKKAVDRKIWTIGLSEKSLNNFTTSNSTELQGKFLSSSTDTSTKTNNLINFIRGVDSYDQNANSNVIEERHKLNDIYHANIIVSLAPTSLDTSKEYNIYSDSYYKIQKNYNNFVNGGSCGTTCSSRKEIILAGSNSGILHAFDSSTGEELWGFIPPSLLRKLPNIISEKANVTNSIYGVDGPAFIKDIYYNGSWKTVYMQGLGMGGKSYFALDITNPLLPTHLFTIENDDSNKMIIFWDKDGTQTNYFYSGIIESRDFTKLGEAWSSPKIIRLKINNVDKWVSVFGAGFNGGIDPNLGSAVFISDLENGGTLVKKIDIEDIKNSIDGSKEISNSVPSDIAIITANGTDIAEYYGAMIYVADYEGKITKINLTSQGTLYEKKIIFNVEADNKNERYIFYSAEPAIDKNNSLWLYFGTGNVQKIQNQSDEIVNYIYGIKDKDFPNFGITNIISTKNNCKEFDGTCPSEDNVGWYLKLEKSQKLTGQATISADGEYVYFPIYEPSPVTRICDAGNGILKSMTAGCGATVFSEILAKGVLTKAVSLGNNIFVGVSGQANVQNSNFKATDSLITTKQGNPISLISVDTWREN